jgi:hypothetical protein
MYSLLGPMTAESIVNVFDVLVSGTVVWALWRAGQPKPVFTIRVIDGRPQTISGTVTSAFLERVGEVVAANGISAGAVRGYAYGSLIRLRFSAEITGDARQQLRNWWASFGWRARHHDDCRSRA